MRLLLVNYEMDESSSVLGWQARVAQQLARSCEFVTVLTEHVGHFQRLANMEVVKIPRRPLGVPRRLGGAWLANAPAYTLCRRHGLDACFFHMAHEWAIRLSPMLTCLRIPSLLWYAHGTVTTSLHLAHAAVRRVITSTPEGFRIPSAKVRVIGQGIDTTLFDIPEREPTRSDILYVGRVSRRKRVDLLLDSMAEVCRRSPLVAIRLRIVGPTLTDDDRLYHLELEARRERLRLQDRVEFMGPVSPGEIQPLYRSAFLHINVSQTGSMDKTVLEALACGCPVLTSNEAFQSMLVSHPTFIISEAHPEIIAKRVLALHASQDQYPPTVLRDLVVGKHDLKSYCRKVLEQIKELL